LATPAEERWAAIVELLTEMRVQDGVPELEASETPRFIGAAIYNIFCPHCGTTIMDWWSSEAMGQWVASQSLETETPCCHRATSLNDLDYDPPVGFAVFRVELMNPWGDLEPEELRQVEAVFGMPVRVIWVHI
jgi:hypothetical protein